ncbi:hypothetical protein [Tahibacter amnicola]|uniref:Oligogalacturonide lyase n=1 Tax=Tahibacter amnicola TaxID=2976241 RepID=A0ABY6BFY6_9GAMM|nr:hypothetical protein [Tahibacter amnicola]UXI68929.1 hypothetical protein N4264_04540 [Tahibacter amnicola]
MSAKAGRSWRQCATVAVCFSGAGLSAPSHANLCEGLVTDKLNHPLSVAAVSKPAARQSFTDPQFGTRIRRVTDAAAIGKTYVKTMYSTQPAWNADESLLLLLSTGYQHVLYDGRTYQFIRNISSEISPSDGEQVLWDNDDPQVIYYANRVDRRFYRYNVVTRARTMLRDFNAPPASCTQDLTMGSDPMFGAWVGGKTGLTCGTKNWVYDFRNDVVHAVVNQVTQNNNPQTAYIVAPSGDKVFLSYLNNQAQVRSLEGQVVRTIANLVPHEHASLGKYANGHDAFFGVQFGTYEGSVVGADLDTGQVRVHVGPSNGWPYPPSGTHVSALATKNPGWVVVSSVGQLQNGLLGQSVLENELYLANVDTGVVCRIGHHRSAAGQGSNGYFSEPHPVLSPSGTRVAFNSDWFNSGGAETYVVELPAYDRIFASGFQ